MRFDREDESLCVKCKTRAQACTVIMRMRSLLNSYNPGDNGSITHAAIVLQYVPAGTYAPDGSMAPYYDKLITCDGNLGARSGQVGTVTWGLPNPLNDSYGPLGNGRHVLTRYPD